MWIREGDGWEAIGDAAVANGFERGRHGRTMQWLGVGILRTEDQQETGVGCSLFSPNGIRNDTWRL